MTQRLYVNGSVVTMCKLQREAEAVLTENGKILAVGSAEELRTRAPRARRVDLGGAALLPAFIDAHGHFMGAASARMQVPLEDARSLDDIAGRLRVFLSENPVEPGVWIHAKGYDHNRLAEKRHPDRRFLDAISRDHPMILQHQSGHMGVLNTAALDALGIRADTPAPTGGAIGVEDGALTGYLEENAFIAALSRIPMPSMEAFAGAIQATQRQYASYGIATAQEGMTTEPVAQLYRGYLAQARFALDMVLYAPPDAYETVCSLLNRRANEDYAQNVRVGGYKIFLDGSPQGRTAWMKRPYCGGGCGTATMTDEAVLAAVELAAKTRTQLLAHCNGDAAAVQFLTAVARVEQAYPDYAQTRPVLIHAQLLDVADLPEVQRLGVIPSFFAAHVYHWGDAHIENLGLPRAEHISPAQSARILDIPFTFHQDAPVIEPNMLETVWCAVNRLTASGTRLREQVDVFTALQAVTINAARQYHEEANKGSIAAGKRADFVLLDRNPLRVKPEELNSIRVLQTVKGDEPIFES